MCFFTHVGVFYGRIIFKINENNDWFFQILNNAKSLADSAYP